MSLTLQDAIILTQTYKEFWNLLINDKILKSVSDTFTDRVLAFIKLVYLLNIDSTNRYDILNLLIDTTISINYYSPFNLLENRELLTKDMDGEIFAPIVDPYIIHKNLLEYFTNKYMKDGKIKYSKEMAEEIFNEIDKQYLNNKVTNIMKSMFYTINFKISSKCKRLYGYFKHSERPKPWLINLTTCNKHNMDEILKTMEHEICHLLIYLQNQIYIWETGNLPKRENSHGILFRTLLGKVFGDDNHWDYCMQNYFDDKKVGSRIEIYDTNKDTMLTGIVIKVTKKTLRVKTDDNNIIVVKKVQ